MTQPRLVGGRYELGELIGYGGMAEVHRGRDTRLNREVAIKVLRADLARDPSFLNRFRREAHSAAGLNHPAIVSVFDTGEDIAADGTAVPFIVMEFVEGRTLRDILRAEGKLPARRAMEITAEICAALEFSHRNGIIHRDIKPANVMITRAGAVKVMDFGIARAVADTSATVTQTANVIGTAQYLSPEQARGEQVDARSDVYSTGCLLYELVTGVPPFQGDSPVAVAYQHVRENPMLPSARNPEVPRAVDSIVMKALAKNPLNRYQSAGEMGADLQRAVADQPVVAEAVMTDAERTQFIARSPAPVGTPRQPTYADDEENHRRTGLIWAAVVVALLVVIGVATFLIFGSGNNDEKQMVALESVVGQNEQAATTSLRQQGFRAVKGANSPGPCKDQTGNTVAVDEGSVCVTDPAPGAEVAAGATITYSLYQQRKSQVPFVEGMTYDKAVQALGAAGLMYAKQDVNSTKDEGIVLAQSVKAYTQLKPGTTVTLQVSTGKLDIPDVVGKPLQEAEDAIPDEFEDIDTRELTTRDQSKDGLVAKQTPEPGAYKTSKKIVLSVYKYSAPPPTCTPAATTAPPTTPVTPGVPPSTATSSPGGLPVCATTPSGGSS